MATFRNTELDSCVDEVTDFASTKEKTKLIFLPLVLHQVYNLQTTIFEDVDTDASVIMSFAKLYVKTKKKII